MSSRKLSRERGVTISCDHGAYVDDGNENMPSCGASVYTALVKIKPTRTYAASLGWIRGGGRSPPARLLPGARTRRAQARRRGGAREGRAEEGARRREEGRARRQATSVRFADRGPANLPVLERSRVSAGVEALDALGREVAHLRAEVERLKEENEELRDDLDDVNQERDQLESEIEEHDRNAIRRENIDDRQRAALAHGRAVLELVDVDSSWARTMNERAVDAITELLGDR